MLKEEQKQMKENVAAASKQVKKELTYNYLLAFQKWQIDRQIIIDHRLSFFSVSSLGQSRKTIGM